MRTRTIMTTLAAALLASIFAAPIAAGETGQRQQPYLAPEWLGMYGSGEKLGGPLLMKLSGCGWAGERYCGELWVEVGGRLVAVRLDKVEAAGNELSVYGAHRSVDGSTDLIFALVGVLSGNTWSGILTATDLSKGEKQDRMQRLAFALHSLSTAPTVDASRSNTP